MVTREILNGYMLTDNNPQPVLKFIFVSVRQQGAPWQP